MRLVARWSTCTEAVRPAAYPPRRNHCVSQAPPTQGKVEQSAKAEIEKHVAILDKHLIGDRVASR
jgi:hypothetical protein